MNDVSFLLAKRAITDKVCDLLHAFRETLAQSPVHKKFPFPAETDFHSGKIARGENLKGLPYVVLDFPRLFEQENIFAFRTMFWWGNYFSFTLHLKGIALRQFRKHLLANLAVQQPRPLLVYLGENEWEHDLADAGYAPYKPEHNQLLRKRDVIKLSRKIPVNDFEKLNHEGLSAYNQFLLLLTNSGKL